MAALLPKPRARGIFSLIEHENENERSRLRLKNNSAAFRTTDIGSSLLTRLSVISL
jgi:hypothetical protein